MTLLQNRYELLEVVGEGGQGKVYRALDHQHGRLVAIKVRSVGNADERDDLLREARLLLTLMPHPSLPLVREDFFVGNDYYIVMDWVEGSDLQAVLRREGRPGLPPVRVIDCLDPVASALDHLHSHEPPIVHHDVKPSNIIVTSDDRVVLVDFGIASRGYSESKALGSPGYVAPEIQAGAGAVPASDIFGLAATAYSLLLGAPPEPGSSPRTPTISKRRAKALTRVLRGALSYVPERRPSGATELLRKLRGILAPETVKRDKRRPSWVAIALVLLLLGGASVPIAASIAGLGKHSVGHEASTLTLQTSTAPVVLGNTITLSGMLSFPEAPRTGLQYIVLDRSSTAGPPEQIAAITSYDDGTYSYADTPSLAGTYTYIAHWPGDPKHRAAEASAPSVKVWGRATTLTLTAPTKPVGFKTAVTITAHLAKHGPNGIVSIYVTPFEGKQKLLKTGAVNERGNLIASVVPDGKTMLIASFSGDTEYAAASSKIATILVQAGVTMKLVDNYGTAGGYVLYHAASPIHIKIGILPRLVSGCYAPRLQRATSAGWVSEPLTPCRSIVWSQSIGLEHSPLVSATYRVRVEYTGGGQVESSTSSWAYFRVTS